MEALCQEDLEEDPDELTPEDKPLLTTENTDAMTAVEKPPAYEGEVLPVSPNWRPAYDDKNFLWITHTNYLSREEVVRIAEEQCFAASAGRRVPESPLYFSSNDKWRSLGGTLEMRCHVKPAAKLTDDQLCIAIVGSLTLPAFYSDSFQGLGIVGNQSWIEDVPMCPIFPKDQMAYGINRILGAGRNYRSRNGFRNMVELGKGFLGKDRQQSERVPATIPRHPRASAGTFRASGCKCIIEVTAWASGPNGEHAHLLIERHVDAADCFDLRPWNLDWQRALSRP